MPKKKVDVNLRDWIDFAIFEKYPNAKIVHQWYSVPLHTISNDFLKLHMENLSIQGLSFNPIPSSFQPPTKNYLKDQHFLHVPIYYGIQNFGHDYIDLRRDGVDCPNLVFDEKYGLDEEERRQVSAFKTITGTIAENGAALLALPPGDGKTRVANYITGYYKKKTLVACPSDYICGQWRDNYKKTIPCAKIAVKPKAKKEIFQENDILITTIQALSQGKYSMELLKDIGFFIIDEAHHANAETFKNVLPMAFCKRVLSLTGSPERDDGRDIILSQHIGPVTFQTKRKLNYTVKVIATDLVYPPIKEIKTKMDTFHHALMLTELTQVNQRNEAIVDKLMECFHSGRQTLVLSARRNHLKTLHFKMLDRLDKMELKYFESIVSLFYRISNCKSPNNCKCFTNKQKTHKPLFFEGFLSSLFCFMFEKNELN